MGNKGQLLIQGVCYVRFVEPIRLKTLRGSDEIRSGKIENFVAGELKLMTELFVGGLGRGVDHLVNQRVVVDLSRFEHRAQPGQAPRWNHDAVRF